MGSPSASGKSIVSLAEYAKSNTTPEKDYLTQIVHIWIPVASGSVLKASEETLSMFKKYNIPILAMNGNEDEKGKLVTKRLVQYSNAEILKYKVDIHVILIHQMILFYY